MAEQATNLPELARRLRAPFPLDWVKWRPQGKVNYQGNFRMVCYIDARCVVDRFDEVLGVSNWRSSTRMEGKGWIGRIGIRVVREDGTSEWVEHEDGSDESDIEAFKGGISDALKRAAVRFGVFAYGYDTPSYYAPAKKGNDGKDYAPPDWRPDPKTLPRWFLPEGAPAQQSASQPERKQEPAPAPKAAPPANAPKGEPQPVAQVMGEMGVLSSAALAAKRKLESALRLVPVEPGVFEKVFLRKVDTSTKKGIVGKTYMELAERAILPDAEREKSGGWLYLRWVVDRHDLREWNDAASKWEPRSVEQGHQWRDWTSDNKLYNFCKLIDEWAFKVRGEFEQHENTDPFEGAEKF